MRVFLQGRLTSSVHDEVATQYKVVAKLQADKVANCRVQSGCQV